MKFLLLLFSLMSYAETRPIIDRIESMKIKNKGYVINLQHYEKPIFVAYSSEVTACLENANKSDMEVVLKLNAQGTEITSCKLYTNPRVLNFRKVRDSNNVPGVWKY
jgi:hypothetical protein